MLCSLGLMFFPDPLRGLSEFHRVPAVRRSRGRVGVDRAGALLQRPDQRCCRAIYAQAWRKPPPAPLRSAIAARLHSLFAQAGFTDIETHTEKHTFVLPSFDAYYGPFARGGASTGQAIAIIARRTLRRAIREEVRRDLGDMGGPVEIEMEIRFASGRR